MVSRHSVGRIVHKDIQVICDAERLIHIYKDKISFDSCKTIVEQVECLECIGFSLMGKTLIRTKSSNKGMADYFADNVRIFQ